MALPVSVLIVKSQPASPFQIEISNLKSPDLHPPDVARILYGVAFYVFERGDTIKNGETVPGVLGSDRWRCQHVMALVVVGVGP